MSTCIAIKGSDLKIGDMIIEYTESGDIYDIGIITGPKVHPDGLHLGFVLHMVITNREGWWNKEDSFPFYLNSYLGFEWIGQ